MFQQITLNEKNSRKPYKQFELYKKLCSYSGRDFGENCMPKAMVVVVKGGMIVFPADGEPYFTEVMNNG